MCVWSGTGWFRVGRELVYVAVMDDIKAMGLYRNVDRIHADLAAAGFGPDDPVTVDDLTAFDQLHYEGTAAVDDACAALGIDAGSRVLDVGAGFGGPARYVADRTGAQVTALELQPDIHETAQRLSERCGLAGQVAHVNGDVLTGVMANTGHSHLMSMLCFLHIPDRAALFNACAAAVEPNGHMFIDDYFAREPLTAEDQGALDRHVFCSYLPDLATYVRDVEAGGFVDVDVVDKTADWTSFVADRYAAFSAAAASLAARYDAETVASLDSFYGTVADLFATGRLGGVRLTARRAV